MVHIVKDGNKYVYGYRELACDTQDDFDNLVPYGLAVGSKCTILSNGISYRLNGSYEWDPISSENGNITINNNAQSISLQTIQNLLEAEIDG